MPQHWLRQHRAMLACLNVPAEKLAKRAIDSAAQRIIPMREVLGDALPDLETIYQGLVAGFAEGLSITPTWGEITDYEEELTERIFREEIGPDGYHRRTMRWSALR
jgi:lipoate---protein ligase